MYPCIYRKAASNNAVGVSLLSRKRNRTGWMDGWIEWREGLMPWNNKRDAAGPR